MSFGLRFMMNSWELVYEHSVAVNRSQMTQGAEIMGQVVPIVIHLMMNDHQRVWGEACYPVVD
jgi:hypothetical protein